MRFHRFVSLLLVLLLAGGFLLPASAAPQGEIFVSPSGDDTAAGTFTAPFATLQGAQAYLKAHKEDYPNGAKIVFRAGTYTFGEEALFTAADLPGVSFCAYENEEVVFSAAVPLAGFAEAEVNGVKTFTLRTDLRFVSLYHPTHTVRTPRWPETGNFTVKSVDRADDLFTAETAYWSESRGNTSINADPAEVGLDFAYPASVYCRITHAWLDEIAPIRFYDASTGKVGLGRPATYHTEPGDVFWFENVFEALDAPGEWYLNEETGTLYYIPFEGETPENITLYAPVSPFLLRIDGCSGLTFRNIRFAYSEWTLAVPPHDGGVRDTYNIDAYQASTESEAAVNVLNADGISFVNCEFIGIGNTALKFVKNDHNCTVKNCLFRNIGSTAIAMYGENVSPDAENAAEAMSGFTIENNLVEAWGRNTYESTGVHLMYVSDSVVSHNEIRNGYYTGLSCGWIWGHEYQVTKNVQITDNLIYDIGQGWLSDLGGMYLLGEQPGTVIARNVIYNVTRGHGVNDYGGNGIYTDAGSSYFTIENNLIYDCAANGLNLGGYNKGHVVRNNIAAFCKLACFDPGWGDGLPDDCTCDCTGNIFYADNAPVILDLTKKAAYTEGGNLLWDRVNGEKVFGSTGYSSGYEHKTRVPVFFAKQNGYLKTDVIADPLFADPENRDFTLQPGSPALTEIGFTPVDLSGAGTLADTPVGCGSAYTRGSISVVHDLSAYPNACEKEAIPYAVLAFGAFAPWLIVPVLLAAAALNFLTFRKRTLPAAKRVPLLLAAPVMLALLYPMYLVFVKSWQPVGYGVCLLLFSAAACVTAWLAVRRLPVRLIAIVLTVGVMLGITFCLNNVLRLGEDVALFTGLFITSLCVLVFAAVLLRKTRKEKEKTA